MLLMLYQTSDVRLLYVEILTFEINYGDIIELWSGAIGAGGFSPTYAILLNSKVSYNNMDISLLHDGDITVGNLGRIYIHDNRVENVNDLSNVWHGSFKVSEFNLDYMNLIHVAEIL